MSEKGSNHGAWVRQETERRCAKQDVRYKFGETFLIALNWQQGFLWSVEQGRVVSCGQGLGFVCLMKSWMKSDFYFFL